MKTIKETIYEELNHLVFNFLIKVCFWTGLAFWVGIFIVSIIEVVVNFLINL
jgi:hypothetical protein